jgi:hypothetical protein
VREVDSITHLCQADMLVLAFVPGDARDPLGLPGALEDMQQDRNRHSGEFL